MPLGKPVGRIVIEIDGAGRISLIAENLLALGSPLPVPIVAQTLAACTSTAIQAMVGGVVRMNREVKENDAPDSSEKTS